ncbi:MAG: hypothetical protein NTZ34_12405 [Chloroflexi bacterium]|nr:hypothetical protein [Chloroflexota bacterium]
MQYKRQTIHLTLDDAEELLETFKVIRNLRVNGSPEAKLAFIHKYINQISIDPWGNLEIRGKFDIAKENRGVYPRWSKGRVIFDDLKSNNVSNIVPWQSTGLSRDHAVDCFATLAMTCENGLKLLIETAAT